MLIKLNEKTQNIIDLIKKNGYEAYVVGGYIRDSLLGKETYDVDITTNATPIKLKEILKEYELEESFSDLGSIKFKMNKYHVEITTYRKEFDYINHRKPSKIEFANSLKEDLIRRDFTINAICSDGNDIIDLFGGMKDLDNKQIKTIGDPFVRLEEDTLRVLRAIRFASKLNFVIDKKLDDAIIQNYKYLSEISFETKYRELKGIIEGNYFTKIIKKYKEILKDIFNLDDLNVELFKENMNYEEREALFFYYSNNVIKNKYLLNKNICFNQSKIDLKNKLFKYGKEKIYDILYFRSTILNINNDEFKLLKEIIDGNECYNLKMLMINGEDLLNINVENNKIGKYLNLLLYAVIENKCKNEKNELLKYLKKYILD